MNILHVTRYCHLDAHRGTENYILELILASRDYGVKGSIAWFKVGERSESLIDQHGIRITAFPCSPMPVDSPPNDLEFEAEKYFTKNSLPDILHFHTFGRSEAALAQWAKDRGIPYVFTYHSPAWSCRRGDLLRWGKTICDGEVGTWRCAVCLLQQRFDCKPVVAFIVASIASPLGLIGRFFEGKVRRRTAFLEDTAIFRRVLREFLRDARKVVACCDWSIPVLRMNGADPLRIVSCPQGVAMSFSRAAQEPLQTGRSSTETDKLLELASANKTMFTIGYVGRITWTKGVHILVEAFRNLNVPESRLRIVGWESETEKDTPYVQSIRKLIGDDSRIQLIPSKPFDEMMCEYLLLDLLAIPSIWLETGPLTLLEAIQMGVLVYGSETLGQKHLLGNHGKVVSPNTVEAWINSLTSASIKFQAGTLIKHKEVRVRTMREVAADMHSEIYKR